nr:pentatricopeptide repeat-containing protein [Tanacetum cinerariifolium]
MKPWVDIICENSICLGGHRDHVSACLYHMLYCIETFTPYNLAFFILKRMEKTRNKPKELLPYGMLLTRFFKHVVSVFPELVIDHYLSHDRVMHPLAPYYDRKTLSNHGKKRPCDSNASSSSTTLNHPSLSPHLDDIVDDKNEESFRSNSFSPSQNVSSSSNVVSRVRQNPPHEKSSTKNLIPTPHECIIVSDNGSQSTEPINDDSSNPLSDESTVKSDYFDEFYGPFIPIHILEEERTKRDHADYIKRMEMLFIINPHDEVDVDGDLREHEYSESEDFDLDNPLLPLPPPEPPDKEFDFEIDFEKEISVERNLIVKFECIDARMKFDVENDVFMFIMFSLLFAESEDTIFDPSISD